MAIASTFSSHPLSDAAQRRLLRAAQRGDARARDALIRANLPLVIFIAKRFYRPGGFMEMDDLIQQGCLGLLRAIERFNLRRKTRGKKIPFAHYAGYWIAHMIRRDIQNNGRVVAVPVHVQGLKREQEKLQQHTQCLRGTRLCAAEVAARLRISPQQLQGLLQAAGEVVPLDPLNPEDFPGQRRLVGPVTEEPDHHLHLWGRQEEARRLLACLTERERWVIERHFGLIAGQEPQSYEAVGRGMGLSRERARQIEQRALRRLREAVGRDGSSPQDNFQPAAR